jgi:hypothetical protein
MRKFKVGSLFIIILMVLTYQLSAQSINISSAGGASASNIPELLTSNLYNNSGSDITGYISFEVKSNNTLVLSGTTDDLTVPTLGNLTVNELNAENLLMPFNYTYIESSISSIVNNSNTLPNGNYQIFLTFMVNNVPESSVFNNYKFIGANSTGGTLILITPFNNSEPPTLTPFFTWVGLGNDVLYEIKITEVLQGQINSLGASINNTAFHFEDSLSSFNYFYGLDAPELQECVYYEWQVTAYEETFTPGEGGGTTTRTNIATSNIFRFGSQCSNEALRMSMNKIYFNLSKQPSPFIYNVYNDVIAFKYIENYSADSLNVTIKDYDGNVRYSPESGIPLDTSNNQNTGVFYIEINKNNLNDPESLDEADILFLEVNNAKGDTWMAKFRFKD